MNLTRITWRFKRVEGFLTSRIPVFNSVMTRNIKMPTNMMFEHDITRNVIFSPLLRQYCPMNSRSMATASEEELDAVLYEKVCIETLESLTSYFEELVETKDNLSNAEVSFSSGVLTVNLGKHGTYVMNRQSPNKQIWLSSPFSGPKRYDFYVKNQCWVYKRDSKTLHELLQSEISEILGEDIDMSECVYSKYKKC